MAAGKGKQSHIIQLIGGVLVGSGEGEAIGTAKLCFEIYHRISSNADGFQSHHRTVKVQERCVCYCERRTLSLNRVYRKLA